LVIVVDGRVGLRHSDSRKTGLQTAHFHGSLIIDRHYLQDAHPYEVVGRHRQHLLTTNPIESTFATLRHRTARAGGCVSRDSMLHMMFKFGECAEKNWQKLRGFTYLAKVIDGVEFGNEEEVKGNYRVAA
jgi:hypothetical protein